MKKELSVKKCSIVLALMITACLGETAAIADTKSGEAEFKKHCAVCHPNGGNIMNPRKTLSKKDLTANNIKTAEDLVKIVRNPGPGMTKFDEKTLPDKKRQEIAEYILKTFK